MSLISQEVLDVIGNSIILGNGLILPNQLDRKVYLATNEVLDRAGGKWNKKLKQHVFDDAGFADTLAAIIETGELPPKNPFAFYATPDHVAEYVVSLTALTSNHHGTILEPSAGDGQGLVKAIHRVNPHVVIDACEIESSRYQILSKIPNVRLVGTDFLEMAKLHDYDLIIMNPPFAITGDATAYITHINHAWGCLNSGGQLIAITTSGVQFQQTKKVSAFRDFCWAHGRILDLPTQSFKESGTGVNTCVVQLYR